MLGPYTVPSSRRSWLLSVLLFIAAIAPTLAQTGTNPDAPPAHMDTFNGASAMTSTVAGYESRSGTSLFVKVLTENGKNRLDRQALVKLNNQTLQTVSWQTTSTEESQAAFGDLPFGHYELEVSALGYLPTHKEFQVVSILVPIHLEIELKKDPEAVKLTLEEGVLPKEARKNAKHGMAALKSGKWNDADKDLEAAHKLAPDNPDLNFLLGYVFYEKKDYGRAGDYLGPAITLSPHNVQALTLLGRVALQQADYGRAVSSLERAIVADSDYWVAHDLLAASYLKERQFEKARDQAQIAIEKGKNNATASQLVLGQALVNLGQKQEGIQTLKAFVQAAPKNPSVPQVKELIAKLESPDAASGGTVETVLPSSAKVEGVDPMIAAAEPTFSLRPWQPAGIDTNRPSVATGITCPVENVIQQSGARVKEFVEDVSRIAAIEHLLHEQLDEIGDPITKETRTFNYVASVSESTPGFVSVEEYRQEHLGVADFPDQIASSGFATLALVFHPAMRDNFSMVCEGLGEWQGQAAWLVHFKQRDDRPARMHDYKVGSQVYALKLKGRAWITADKFQIVRIESELVSPVPQIRLAGEHQVVEYGPVPFAKKNAQLWLPKSAEIYLDFRRHRYYRKHSFDHYMLFSVDADEKRKEPKAPADAKPIEN
jgi:tetratricopeptide (TPR) repeat protein